VQIDTTVQQHLLDELGVGDIGGRHGGRCDGELELRYRHLARMEDALVKLVLFLHPLGELEIKPRVTELGLTQDADDLLRREPDRRIDNRVDIADTGKGRRRLFLAQHLVLDWPAV